MESKDSDQRKKKTYSAIGKGLGRGLSQLFEEKKVFNSIKESRQNKEDLAENESNASDGDNRNKEEHIKLVTDNVSSSNAKLEYIDINLIRPCPTQPRKIFEKDLLEELAESIKNNGVLQPIIVHQENEEGFYEIIAGERRWRASKMANINKMPVIIKQIDEEKAFLYSIIENIQRAELLPIEESEVYSRLFDNGHTHEEISSLVNKSRSYISNMMRLNNLPFSVKQMLNSKELTIGHARALVNLENAAEIAVQIIAADLNVRETERLIKKMSVKNISNLMTNQAQEESNSIYNNSSDSDDANNQNKTELRELENFVSKSINAKVVINDGSINIKYKDFADLDRIVNLLISQEKCDV